VGKCGNLSNVHCWDVTAHALSLMEVHSTAARRVLQALVPLSGRFFGAASLLPTNLVSVHGF
jgi:glyceraldehyde-3-phosphate dehydrogenase/erythrose-4-phosphate dehydrogenase